MKYVLDSSVALKWVLPEKDSDKAIALRDAGHEFHAPDVFAVEIGHVLSKAFRQKKLTEAEAFQDLTDLLDSRPALHSSMRLLARAFEMSLQTRCTLYDALYVSLAEREGCGLVTADDALVSSLQSRFAFVERLADV
jgi:predicted nucleic acid-binding protein